MEKKNLSIFLSLLLIEFSISTIAEKWYDYVPNPFNVTTNKDLDFSNLNQKEANQRIKAKGEIFIYSNGTKVRFFGTNYKPREIFANKTQAEANAKKMASLGINVVRFHYFDEKKNSIFEDKNYTIINQTNLDNLHHTIYQLKKNGIYVNINLHVAKTYKEVEDEYSKLGQSVPETFKFGKSIDQFSDGLIEEQKKYAKDLLTSFNKYTGYALTDDPAIAFIEINNENTIFSLDGNYYLLNGTKYMKELETKWHEYLNNTYKSYEAIYKEINPTPLNETYNYLKNLTYNFDIKDNGTKSEVDGYYRIEILSDSTQSSPFRGYFKNFPELEVDIDYTFNFTARADPPRAITFQIYETTGWSSMTEKCTIYLSTKAYTFTNIVKTKKVKKDSQFRLFINYGKTKGYVDIKNFKFYKGTDINVGDGKTIDSVPVNAGQPYLNRIFRQFLYYTETKTHKLLSDYIKNTLKAKSLMTSTQTYYGSILTIEREGTISDFNDVHHYWQLPNFAAGVPHTKENFRIKNIAMVDDLKISSLTRICNYRLKGKPYTISEFNMPYPNRFEHEYFPIMVSAGGWQDMGAMYPFMWGGPFPYPISYISDYFSVGDNSVLTITSHIMARAFRKEIIKPSKNTITIHHTKENIWKKMAETQVKVTTYDPIFNRPYNDAIYLTVFEEKGEPYIESSDKSMNITGETPLITEQFNLTHNEEHGIFAFNEPSFRILSGFFRGEERKIGDVIIHSDTPEKFSSTIIVESLDDREIKLSEKIVVVVASSVFNKDQKWNVNETGTTVWGTDPVALYVECNITIPGDYKPTVYILDPNGNKNGTLDVNRTIDGSGYYFLSDINRPSLWYFVERHIKIDDGNDNNNSSMFVVIASVSGIIVLIIVGFCLFRCFRKNRGIDKDNLNVEQMDLDKELN